MDIVIIEDEFYTAEYLKDILAQLDPAITVTKVLSSVEESIEYFSVHQQPDLIFSDIQLTDGQSFDIFKHIHIRVPIIFTTAYDEFALEAFKTNGIDYILKPIVKADVKEAIDKYELIMNSAVYKVLNYTGLSRGIVGEKPPGGESSSLLIKFRDSIFPVKYSDIAYFIIVNKTLHVRLLNGSLYGINKTLEEVESVCGNNFYRVNRQALVSKTAIEKVMQTSSRKLIISLKLKDAPDLAIHKNKVSEFLLWLSH